MNDASRARGVTRRQTAQAQAPRPLVEVDSLRVNYAARDVVALDGIDLAIAPGEHVLVMGPSGSGKSTLLHTLCGVVPGAYDADVDGRVRIGPHEDVPSTPIVELARTVGLLGQDPPSQVCLPLVEDELGFVLENRSVAPAQIGPSVAAMLQRFGLTHLAHRRTGQLSGGELQRVGLAATLLGEPQLLLLDEPTAMLDPDAARTVAATIAEVSAIHGLTTIVVEHRLEELAHLPERVVVLDAAGHLVADGPAIDVFATHGASLARTGAWLPLAVELSLSLGLLLEDLTPGRGEPVDGQAAHRPAVPTPEEVLSREDADKALRNLAARHATHRPPVPSAARREGDAILRARGAAFSTGGHVLVRDVDLELDRGQVTAVVGTNGSGKTSLLLGLAGLLSVFSGSLEGAPAGMVFQHPEDQFVGRTVADDVAHGLRAAGFDGAALDARVDAALERFALAEVAEADPFRLSGGQKRRLSVAAMAVLDHPVLLLDEPTFGQDRAMAATTADALVRLARSGTAVVLATHDLRMVARIADHVVLLADGRVVAAGTPARLFADEPTLQRAGLGLPALLAWWARNADTVDLAGLLDGLHAALPHEPRSEQHEDGR